MHLVLLDLNNLLCRSFFVSDKIYTKYNQPVGALCGLAVYINNLIRMLGPTHIAMARDLGGKTWRHKLYPQYKQNRVKADEELYAQFPLVPALSRHLKIQILEDKDFEADDCLAAMAVRAQEYANVTVVSTDKDLLQIMTDKIRVYSPHTRSFHDAQTVRTKYNVDLCQIRDYFALTGDSCDNLPGVQGIGPKGAIAILEKCKNLDHVYDYMHCYSKLIQDKLNKGKEQLKLMRHLVTLSTEMELTIDFDPNSFDVFKFDKMADVRVDTLKTIFEKEHESQI